MNLPEHGKQYGRPVIIRGENTMMSRRLTIGFYCEAFEIAAERFDDPENVEKDENGKAFLKAGWYDQTESVAKPVKWTVYGWAYAPEEWTEIHD